MLKAFLANSQVNRVSRSARTRRSRKWQLQVNDLERRLLLAAGTGNPDDYFCVNCGGSPDPPSEVWSPWVPGESNQVDQGSCDDASKSLALREVQSVVPNKKAKLLLKKYWGHIRRAMNEFDINTPRRQAAFLAQVAYESNQFKNLVESQRGAKKYENNKRLGNVKKGDGVRFRGRGAIHLTGRRNYTLAQKHFKKNFTRNPQLVSRPEWAFRTAAWFWKRHGLNELADSNDFNSITRKINGPSYHKHQALLAIRQRYWDRAMEALDCEQPNASRSVDPMEAYY